MNIELHGLLYGHSGFAQALRNIALNLDKLGCNIKTFPNDMLDYKHLEDTTALERLDKMLVNGFPDKKSIAIHLTHPLGQKRSTAQYNIGFAMFETAEMPMEFTKHLQDEMDELWTPSSFNRDQFRQTGFTKPLCIMPLGVNTNEFDPRKHDTLMISDRKKFMFLSIMGFSERKGVDPLVTAFCKEFSGDEDVCLFIKGGWYDKKKGAKYINEIIKKSGNPNPPRVMFNFDLIRQKHIPKLYKSADCFVLASRGEGFGLNYCEAMSMELPTIGTYWSSVTDFMNEKNSFPLKINGVKREPRCDWITEQYKGREFADPSVEHLQELMRFIYDNPKKAKSVGKYARKFMIKNYDWKVSVKKMYKRLKQIERSL